MVSKLPKVSGKYLLVQNIGGYGYRCSSSSSSSLSFCSVHEKLILWMESEELILKAKENGVETHLKEISRVTQVGEGTITSTCKELETQKVTCLFF